MCYVGVLPGNVTQGCLLHESVANLYLCIFLLKCHINFVFMICLESFSFPRCGVGSSVLLTKGIFFYIMLIFQLIIEVVTCEDSLIFKSNLGISEVFPFGGFSCSNQGSQSYKR